MRIRDAVAADAEALVEIATAVRMPRRAETGLERRGFLIDVSLEQYRYFIENDQTLVVEEDGAARPLGFSVIMGPRTMEASGIRARAERIQGSTVPIHELDPSSCAYWEQLAVLPRFAGGIYPACLAFASLRRAFQSWEHLFGAVATMPVTNRAPLRLLEVTGWRRAGSIEEDFPEYGRVRYDVYHLPRGEFERRSREPLIRGMEKRLRARGVLDRHGDGEGGR